MKSFISIQIVLLIIQFCIASKIVCEKKYKIKKDDYCYGIATKHEISISKLKIINPKINCDDLKVGDNICVKAKLNYHHYVDKINVNGKCGDGIGRCPKGECCSKEGYCGVGKEYCDNGCQSEFGECSNPKISSHKRSEISSGETNEEDYYGKMADIEKLVDFTMSSLFSKEEAEEFKKFAEEAFKGFENALAQNHTVNEYDLDTFNINECQANCNNALNQFENVVNDSSNNFNLKTFNYILISSDQGSVDENYFANVCRSQCYFIEEFITAFKNDNIMSTVNHIQNEINELDEVFKGVLTKRNTFDCSTRAKTVTVDHFASNDPDIPVYKQSQDSIFLCKSGGRIDGCSAQYKILDDFMYYFTPACNGHDACYHCNGDKTQCDDQFKNNMINLCEKNHSIISRPKSLFSCKSVAYVAHLVVKHADFAWDGWRSDRAFTNNNFNKNLDQNTISDYCVCDAFDQGHFVSKLYSFTPYE